MIGEKIIYIIIDEICVKCVVGIFSLIDYVNVNVLIDEEIEVVMCDDLDWKDYIDEDWFKVEFVILIVVFVVVKVKLWLCLLLDIVCFVYDRGYNDVCIVGLKLGDLKGYWG